MIAPGPSACARLRGRGVVLAQVHAVRAHRGRERDVVVDDERHAAGATQLDERARLARAPFAVVALVTVLHRARAAVERAPRRPRAARRATVAARP